MRVWHRGTDTLSPAAVPIAAGPNPLGNTGVAVTFSGSDRVPGDFWVIAVRPETPEEIMPWAYQHQGMRPHGFRRFYTPLAVIRWTQEGTSGVEGKIIRDCRKTFRPLTQLESCCAFDVGDGARSFGDFNNLEEAIANLPERGGKICLLPGEHYTNAIIRDRKNITISGCGSQSLLFPRTGSANEAIITISDSSSIQIENLSFIARKDPGILLVDSPNGEASNSITIRNNSFLAVKNAIYIHTQSESAGDNNIYIGHNQIAIPNIQSAGVGIFCLADSALIERNKIGVVPAPDQGPNDTPNDDGGGTIGIFDPCDQPPGAMDAGLAQYIGIVFGYLNMWGSWELPAVFLALGGIQIGASSERVSVFENTITGGAANGVTLGHLPSIIDHGYENPTLAGQLNQIHRNAILANDLDVDSLDAEMRSHLSSHFLGHLYEIQVERNTIKHMGLAGVGVVCFFEQSDSDTDFLVVVEDLLVDHNRIELCAQQIPASSRNSMMRGFGGVVLAELEHGVIVENLIKDCGISTEDPVCGVYISSGDHFTISNNRILNNGPELDQGTVDGETTASSIRQGSRGGIFIAMAIKTNFINLLTDEIQADGIPAAMIHDNIVVQPLGQALFMIAMGPVSVEGNTFTSQDQDQRNQLTFVAGTVFIVNLGISKDLIRLLFEPTLQALSTDGQTTNNAISAALMLLWLPLQYLPSGQVLFNDNQVTFDQRNLEVDITISSVAIITLDDLSFVSNQLECLGIGIHLGFDIDNLPPLLSLDYCIVDALLAGVSLRVADNRFQEGYTGTAYSLFSLGMFNTTTGNQSSHCMFTYGRREVFANNIEGIFENFECEKNRDTIFNQVVQYGQKRG